MLMIQTFRLTETGLFTLPSIPECVQTCMLFPLQEVSQGKLQTTQRQFITSLPASHLMPARLFIFIPSLPPRIIRTK